MSNEEKSALSMEVKIAKTVLGFAAQSGAKAAVSIALKHHSTFAKTSRLQKYTIPVGIYALSSAAGRVAKREMHASIDDLDQMLQNLQRFPEIIQGAKEQAESYVEEKKNNDSAPSED